MGTVQLAAPMAEVMAVTQARAQVKAHPDTKAMRLPFTVAGAVAVVMPTTCGQETQPAREAQATKALSTSAYRRKEGKNEICSFD